ncbi:MAG TPA: hypothetical protein VNZ52_15520 [Candidatus Thermoplasmatota archaeon]|nr:hypothetical protein [Candidatus Thermoplasmatota archaeon]
MPGEADRIVLDERERGDWLRYGRRAVVKEYARALEANPHGCLLVATPLEDMKEEHVPGLKRSGRTGRPVAAVALNPPRLLAVFNARFEAELRACLAEEADLKPLGLAGRARGSESLLAFAYLLYERLGTNLKFEPYLGLEGA